jgi:RNA polymerase sigma-70 factor (ECF subfamily)
MSRLPSPPEAGVEALYAASYLRLVGVSALVAEDRGEAEDAVQEAFARLLPRWEVVSRYDDPEAWVRTVAFRLLLNRRRQLRSGVRALALLGVPSHVAAPSAEHVDLVRALRLLPAGHRQVVVLHHLLGLSVDDVAASLHLPVGTVKSRLSRSRAALVPLLREDPSHA